MKGCEVAVIGGGVMGCATAYALARRGISVLLLEADRIGGGSSKGTARIIRLAYGSVDYIALCRAAYRAWEPLEDSAREILLYTTGGLDIGSPQVATWQNARQAMAAAKVPFDDWSADGLRARFPQFRLPDGERALYQPDAGVLHADRCIAALVAAARGHGCVVQENVRVASIETADDSFILRAGDQKFSAKRLVLAPGASMRSLAGLVRLDLPLEVSMEQVAYFRPRHTAAFTAGRFPLFILHLPGGRLSSGFPLLRDPGMKLMLEKKQATMAGDPGSIDGTLLETLRERAMNLLPDLTGEILDSETCAYTLTPDEDFILDRHPSDPRIILISACSGHGFKFGALFGEAAADLVQERRPAIDIGRFSLSRFGERALSARPVVPA